MRGDRIIHTSIRNMEGDIGEGVCVCVSAVVTNLCMSVSVCKP